MADTAANRSAAPVWLKASPAIFVVLWSTGFIFARLGMPYAEPFSFLVVRFALVLPVLILIALVGRAPWQRSWQEIGHNIVVGVLLHGIYLGFVFAAIARGMPVGLAALIVGLTPVLTALSAGPLLGERVGAVQWTGIVMGFAGLTMVVHDKTGVTGASAWGWDGVAMALCIGALFGLAAGNLYQKRFGGPQDMRTATVWQYVGALAFVGPIALAIETNEITWSGEFLIAIAWLVLVMSVGAIFVLMLIIRHGEISRVAALYYLVPPLTAVLGYVLFGEAISTIEIVGIAITAAGVALVSRKPA